MTNGCDAVGLWVVLTDKNAGTLMVAACYSEGTAVVHCTRG